MRDLGFDVVVFEIDVRDLQLLGERLGDFFFGNAALLDEYAPEFATAALLFVERKLQLLLGQQLLLYENFA